VAQLCATEDGAPFCEHLTNFLKARHEHDELYKQIVPDASTRASLEVRP
jgi:hypothetical protein